MSQPQLLDIVALLKDVPVERLTLLESEYQDISYLPSGLIGTIVEIYQHNSGYYYQVEFADPQGCEYAMAILKADELLILHPELTLASQSS